MVMIINPDMAKIKIKHEVEEETIEIGKGTPKTSQQETKRMLEERLDTMTDPQERAVYEKVWRGVK